MDQFDALDDLLGTLFVERIEATHLDAEPAEIGRQHTFDAAIDVAAHRNSVTRLQEPAKNGMQRGHARRKGNRAIGIFELRHFLLEETTDEMTVAEIELAGLLAHAHRTQLFGAGIGECRGAREIERQRTQR
jgi:hypothetical protein